MTWLRPSTTGPERSMAIALIPAPASSAGLVAHVGAAGDVTAGRWGH